MNRGYIKLYRRLKDSDFWLSEKFSNPQAWVDLLMLANHKDTFFKAKGQRIDVKRGQVAYSEVSLAERWKWSRGKVRRFLKELSSKTVQQIVQHKNNITTLITIINYELYQGDGTALGTPDGTADSTADGTHLKNVKNEKNKSIDPRVQEIISHLNRLSGKNFHSNGANARYVSARIAEGATVEQCKSVIELKVKEWTGTEYEKYLRPETLFNKTKFESYVNSTPRYNPENTSHVPIN